MTQPLNFQEIVMTLQRFWAEQGCVIWQPYYAQIGAGTMNPATYLRVLGPEPWRVAYVEPSIRPDDGRYGENPNRMQMHYQFQVIIKPDPGNPQDIYLRSLEALGIDLRKHDIRFVEDNWEQPALGAWGLGWEVWLDGQEITQYTYFQQAGGIMLDPVSVEITYGLDRIAIALQRVAGFQDIRWNEGFTVGDVNLQAEQEHSKYYFEFADVARLREMYDLFEAEAQAAIANRLVLPAHDYVLKCSHTFNVLDTRGAIGVTERQAFFGRMRNLSSRVAQLYLEQRQRLEYPWLEKARFSQPAKQQDGETDGHVQGKEVDSARPALEVLPEGPADFVLEIGTEELPANDLRAALDQLRKRAPLLLKDLRLAHGELRVLGTPRRLVVYVQGLSASQEDLEQVVKGPPAGRAFDSLGQPTPAAEGFARSKGVDVSELQVQEMDGGSYAVAVVRSPRRPAPAVLSAALPGLIASLRFDKAMRWNQANVPFSRPIRWLLALFGEQVVPFELAGLASGRATRGLRAKEPEGFTLSSPARYLRALEEQGVLLDEGERRESIRTQVTQLAAEINGQADLDPALLVEVANLVESPKALRGAFDPAYLELPPEVLISVMKKHQRYFPVSSAGEPQEGQRNLLPYFIAIRNGDSLGMDLVVEGNEHVIRARFSDAAFFIEEDLKRSLEEYLPRLKTLSFQQDLGTMWDKTERLQDLVPDLVPHLGLDAQEAGTAVRAARLCKADLATKMVVEMTSLQGTIGRYYAVRSGEEQAVAKAIFEHYLPRFSGDVLPATRPGLAVAIADRLDTLAGLFAAGLAPTGAKDPFALRRAALGLVQNLITWEMDFDLRVGLAAAAARLPQALSRDPEEANSRAEACLDFIIERLRNLLLEQGYRHDLVEAVLAQQGHIPASAARAVEALSAWVARPDWRKILPAYARCVRITRGLPETYPLSGDQLIEPAEQELYAALRRAENEPRKPGSVDDFLEAFLPLIPSIDRFFDEVLVMTEDAAQRENRLGLLQRIAALAHGVADMSKVEGF